MWKLYGMYFYYYVQGREFGNWATYQELQNERHFKRPVPRSSLKIMCKPFLQIPELPLYDVTQDGRFFFWFCIFPPRHSLYK